MNRKKKVAERFAGAAEAVALVLLLLTLTARSLTLSRAHPFPVFDEVAYLDLARGFAARGGALATAACYASGRCLEDNRHPLYALALAPFVDGGPGDFARAKLLTLACALALVLVVYGAGRRLWGPGAALAAAALVALSWATALLSQQVLADVLFAALYFASLAALVRGEERPSGWALFGALAGLAYLAKGDGHLLLAAALAVAARRAWRGRRALPHLGAALGAFAATASFLLARNLRVWGSLFHNVNATIFWLDDWSQLWRLSPDAALWKSIGPAWYLRGHGAREILARVFFGAGSTASDLFWGFGTGPSALHRWLAGPLMLLAAVGLRRRWREGARSEALAFGAAAAAVLLALVWGARAGQTGVRLVFPVAASLLPFSVLGAEAALKRLGVGGGRTAAAAVAGALALAFLVPSAGGLSADPRGFIGSPPQWAPASAWLRAHVGPEGYLLPFESLFSTWDGGPDLRRPYPLLAPEAELRERLRAGGIRAILLDRTVGPAGMPADKSGPEDEFGPRTFLDWPRCYHGDERPSELLIFASSCAVAKK